MLEEMGKTVTISVMANMVRENHGEYGGKNWF